MNGTPGFDWAALMHIGLARLRLPPDVFWALSPAELMVMLGQGPVAAPLGRDRLEALAAAFPDLPHDEETEGSV